MTVTKTRTHALLKKKALARPGVKKEYDRLTKELSIEKECYRAVYSSYRKAKDEMLALKQERDSIKRELEQREKVNDLTMGCAEVLSRQYTRLKILSYTLMLVVVSGIALGLL